MDAVPEVSGLQGLLLMRYVVLAVLVAVLMVGAWRATNPYQRTMAWRTARPYILAVAVALVALYLALVLVMGSSFKFL